MSCIWTYNFYEVFLGDNLDSSEYVKQFLRCLDFFQRKKYDTEKKYF